MNSGEGGGADQRLRAENEVSVEEAVAPVEAGTERTTKAGDRVRTGERFAYGLGDVGGNLVFAPVSAFILFYLTDVVGIGAAIAGTLLLFGRFLDGTLDLIVGTLIDRTSTRWGKARPWILFSTPVLVVSFVLLFTVPGGLSTTGKEIYAFVMYVVCLGVGFVCSNLAYHTLLSVITPDSKVRVSLTVIRTFFALFTTLVVNVATVPIVTSLGGDQGAWSTVIITYAIIAAVTFVVLFLGTRERVRPTHPAARNVKLPLGKKVRILVRNRYFFLSFGFFLLMYAQTAAGGSGGIYYASNVLGDPNLYSFFGLVTILPLLIGLWFMPPVVNRFGKRVPILIGSVVIVIGSAVSLIDPANVALAISGAFVRGLGLLPATAGLFALVADVVDYGEWKTGVRLDGMTFAAATAGQNFGAGLGTALVGWMLALGGYNAQAAQQTESALSTEIFLMLWLPAIIAILSAVVIWFLDIDRHLPEVRRDLAARRVSADAA